MALPDVSGEGNLTAEPDIRYVASGKAVANATVACTERKKNEHGEWEDGDQAFIRLTLWGEEAERFAEWGYKGCAVIYRGKLLIRDFEGRDGQKGRSVEVKFVKVAPDPARNVIRVERAQRSGGQGGQQQSQGGGRSWGSSGSSGGSQRQQDGMQAGSGWGRTGGGQPGNKWGSGGGQPQQRSADPWAAVPPQAEGGDPPF